MISISGLGQTVMATDTSAIVAYTVRVPLTTSFYNDAGKTAFVLQDHLAREGWLVGVVPFRGGTFLTKLGELEITLGKPRGTVFNQRQARAAILGAAGKAGAVLGRNPARDWRERAGAQR